MAIIKCPECGHQISEKATRCPSCGVEIAGKVVRCEHCGEVYFNDEVLCPNCHTPQSASSHLHDEDKKPVASSSSTPAKPSVNVPKKEQQEVVIPVVPIQNESRQVEEIVSESSPIEESGITPQNIEESLEDERDESDLAPAEDVSQESTGKSAKSRIMPFFVSLAIASIVGAVSIYFYKESKGSKEQQAYGLALNSNDTLSMSNFLASYSDAPSAHIDSIRSRLDYIRQGERDWDSLQIHKTHEMAATYVDRYPNMSHYAQAVVLLDSIDWADAVQLNTTTAYKNYLAAHQDGKHVGEAREKMFAGNMDVIAPEERQIISSLVQRFFQSINDNDAGQFKSCLSPTLVSFMGTDHPSADEAAGWMKRQHGESVKSVSWVSSGDYEIAKHKKDNGSLEYVVKFSAKQDLVKGDKSSSDRYKISSTVNPDGKMTSLGMVKIVPQEEGKITSSTSSSSSSSTSKPSSSSSSSSSKPSPSPSSNSPKPKTSTSSSSSGSSSKPKTTTSSSSTSSKPKTTTSSSSTSSKPKTSTSSSSTSSKPKTTTQKK